MVFGEVAELYDKARAGYSDAIVDEVLDFAGQRMASPALEIGAGTGKATVAFAARGLEILALEPDPSMVVVARRNCQRFPAVRIEVTTFENWTVLPSRFGLVLSAQAWHWVDPDVRYAKAAEALRPGGALALFWHRTHWQDEELRAELDDLYRRVVPELHAQDPGFPGVTPPHGDDRFLEELRQSGRFEDIHDRTHPWLTTFTADTFVELLLTQSNHRLLAEHRRAVLFEAVRRLVADHGGVVTVPLATYLVLAHRSDDRS
jgi:SAM-dependent methyltransferase